VYLLHSISAKFAHIWCHLGTASCFLGFFKLVRPPGSSRGHPSAKMGPKKGNRFRVRAPPTAESAAGGGHGVKKNVLRVPAIRRSAVPLIVRCCAHGESLLWPSPLPIPSWRMVKTHESSETSNLRRVSAVTRARQQAHPPKFIDVLTMDTSTGMDPPGEGRVYMGDLDRTPAMCRKKIVQRSGGRSISGRDYGWIRY
jgi:hypothetical protein